MKYPAVALLSILLACQGIGYGDAPAGGPEPSAFDRAVQSTVWQWDWDHATAFHSLLQARGDYDVAIVRPHDRPRVMLFKVLDGGREIFSWEGHWRSVFSLQSNRLIYVQFEPALPGGEVVCVDLRRGQELWRSKLKAVPVGGHSVYSNGINLETTDTKVMVFGNEEAGRYFEVKDASTGKTIGHKLFPPHSKSAEGEQRPQ